MGFDIEIAGNISDSVRNRLIEMVGDAALAQLPGRVVVTVDDQAAMIGVVHRLNDLGLDIDRIERVAAA